MTWHDFAVATVLVLFVSFIVCTMLDLVKFFFWELPKDFLGYVRKRRMRAARLELHYCPTCEAELWNLPALEEGPEGHMAFACTKCEFRMEWVIRGKECYLVYPCASVGFYVLFSVEPKTHFMRFELWTRMDTPGVGMILKGPHKFILKQIGDLFQITVTP